MNTARLWLSKLEWRLAKLGLDRGPAGSPLDDYLMRTYGGGEGA